MALRVVLNRCKPWGRGSWGYELAKGKLGSFGNKSIVAHNFNSHPLLPVSFNQSCRHYFLPPPPPVKIVGATIFLDIGGVAAVTGLGSVLPSAQFAVWMYNEAEDRNIRFERVVRASSCGLEYFITLEGIDENGDLNVYYAQVLDVPFQGRMRLFEFQLVDESFSYPFQENRWCERIMEGNRRRFEGKTNPVLGDWLLGMALKNKDDTTFAESIPGPCIGDSNVLGEIMNFEKNALCITELCPPSSNGDMYPLDSVARDEVVPVYNIKDYDIVVKHAWSAVEIYNDKEGENICLEEVLYSRKGEVNGEVFYFLLLEAQNKKKLMFYYAVIKVLQLEVELIKWHVVDELFSGPLQNDQAGHMLMLENCMYMFRIHGDLNGVRMAQLISLFMCIETHDHFPVMNDARYTPLVTASESEIQLILPFLLNATFHMTRIVLCL